MKPSPSQKKEAPRPKPPFVPLTPTEVWLVQQRPDFRLECLGRTAVAGQRFEATWSRPPDGYGCRQWIESAEPEQRPDAVREDLARACRRIILAGKG